MSSDDRKHNRPASRPVDNGSKRSGDTGADASVSHADGASEPVADVFEQAQAASFAALIDVLVHDRALPPAMTADERALIETAELVRAGMHQRAPAPERITALIDDVLHAAAMPEQAGNRPLAATPSVSASTPITKPAGVDVHGNSAASIGAGSAVATIAKSGQSRGVEPDASDSAIISLEERRRGRFLRVLPWSVTVASVAAALVLVFWQGRNGELVPGGGDSLAGHEASGLEASAMSVDEVHRSRSADVLIGEITRSRAAAARARIDMIYADRLSGYRDLRLRGGRL